MVLTKLECNDGLSEYCKNILINELRILNGVVSLKAGFSLVSFFTTKKEQEF